MDQKADHEPFKGITKENPEKEESTKEVTYITQDNIPST